MQAAVLKHRLEPQLNPKRLFMTFLLLLLMCTGCGQQPMSLDEQQINQARAQPYIAALTQYHQIHGTFPLSLDLLDATMEDIPLTTLGETFNYYLERSSSAYLLCFGNEAHRGCCYHQYLDLWDCTGEAAE
jgi:hypothetical protein